MAKLKRKTRARAKAKPSVKVEPIVGYPALWTASRVPQGSPMFKASCPTCGASVEAVDATGAAMFTTYHAH
jgi:hypothetical protein